MKEREFAFYSDVGGRANNEDSYVAKKTEDSYLFVVADGLGGHEDGEVASRAAVDAIKEYLISGQNNDVAGAVERANEIVLARQELTSSKMKTTVALAYVGPEETVIAHVGDTRVYAFRNGKIVFQTMDHSASQLAVSAGEIELSGIRGHVDRNVLTRALGASERVKVDISTFSNDRFDALLLCSDGFWEYVYENEMERELAACDSAKKWLYKLRTIQLDRAPEKCDNNTAIAVLC